MGANDAEARVDNLEVKLAFLEDRVDQLEHALLDKERALARVEEDLAVALKAIERLGARGGADPG